MRTIALWFFRDRQTGAITIGQMPNMTLWVVIVAAVARWIWHPDGRLGVILTILVTGGLLLWSFDELWRGVNPWRRCLGLAVLVYTLCTLRG